MSELFVTPQQNIVAKPVDLTTATETTVYTASNVPAKLVGVLVSASDNTGATITVRYSVGGSADYDLVVAKPISGNDFQYFDFGPIPLRSGDLIKLTAGTANELHAIVLVAEAGGAQGRGG